MTVAVGLNRWDWRTPESFAAGVADAEAAGLRYAFLPVNPLAIPDPYVLMAAGAAATEVMRFGPLLETPVLRPPAVAAGSVATLDAVSGGRAMLTYGIGDTAVRWLGLRPATVAELERAVVHARRLLEGERVEVGAGEHAWLRHARPLPVWVAAGGPRTLRMAGRCADGVFLRVGTHPANLRTAVDAVRDGAVEAGRDPDSVGIGLVIHTCHTDDTATAAAIARSMAAGFYEYSPALFDAPGFAWNGPPVEELQRRVQPDFHHTTDLVAAGGLVGFLDDQIAESFSLTGSTSAIVDQLRAVLAEVPEVAVVVPHPVPMPRGSQLGDYVSWLGGALLPAL